jgi:hypothetical protein
MATALRQDTARGQTLSGLAPHLSESLLDEAIKAARLLTTRSLRAEVLRDISSCDPDSTKLVRGEGLAAASKNLVAYLPVALKDAVVANLVQLLEKLQRGTGRVLVLDCLAPYLPGDLLSRITSSAEKIDDQAEQLMALSKVSAQLSGELVQRIASEAQNVDDPADRAWVLAYLSASQDSSQPDVFLSKALRAAKQVPYLSDRVFLLEFLIDHADLSRRDGLIREAFAAAQAVQVDHRRIVALARLLEYVDDLAKETIVEELIELVDAVLDDGLKAYLVVRLAPYLSQSGHNQRLARVTETIADKGARSIAEVALGACQSGGEGSLPLREALRRAWIYKERRVKVTVVAGLLERMSARIRADCLDDLMELAVAANDPQERLELLDTLMPHVLMLRPKDLYSVWRKVLRTSSARRRGELFDIVRVFTPVLTKLAKDGSTRPIHDAIRDVARWWP